LRIFVALTLLFGAALLAVVVGETDLSEVARRLAQVGPASLAAVLGSYGLGFVFRALAWQLTLPAIPLTPRWLHRALQITMFSCALDTVTPLGGLGGEPVKAVLLKRDFGVRYRDATASLVLSRTTDVVAQVLFIAVGIACLLRIESLPHGLRAGAVTGLAAFALAVLLFFLAQRLRALAVVRSLAVRLGPRLGARALAALEALRDVEEALVAFYRHHRARFGLSLGASLLEWSTGTVAAWFALNALGERVGWADAMAIEAFVVLVRSSLFFVPADVGTQEGALVLACGAVTGSPALGLALAAIRRGADILWILWGLAVGSVYSFRSAPAEGAAGAGDPAPADRRGGAR
jgi:uncharacterized protein (TIRG00374 family)